MEIQRCGQYILHERLNAGGTAEVFTGVSPDNKTIAIRRLLPKFKLNLVKRLEFNRGLAIQAKFEHPNFVRTLEIAALKLVPYAVMEYVDGTNLRQAMLRKDPLLADPMPVFRQILEGLAYLHRCGFLHLDFKPENVILSRQGEVKILDFDLSEPILKKPRAQSAIKGTPGYLAPEQVLQQPVDERTDIFALGVTAYELFAGQKPFAGQDRQEIFRMSCNFDHPFPAARTINTAIPIALDRVLSHCIEKKPDRRYPTVSLILRDLDKIPA